MLMEIINVAKIPYLLVLLLRLTVVKKIRDSIFKRIDFDFLNGKTYHFII